MPPLIPYDETHAVVAGNWHANVDWIGKAIASVARETSGVRSLAGLSIESLHDATRSLLHSCGVTALMSNAIVDDGGANG